LRWLRLLRRTVIEALALAGGAGLAFFLYSEDEPTWAGLAAGLAVIAALAGTRFLWRRGELAIAWRCPRLDALGVKPRSRDVPWPVLRSAEDALAALEGDVKRFESFFETARVDISRTARRALELQALRTRAQRALAHAPEGEARRLLDEQADRAEAELAELRGLLAELQARFIASTAPLHAVDDPTPALRALEQRSGALGDALEEIRSKAPQRVGGNR
jgi:hypothetical protein